MPCLSASYIPLHADISLELHFEGLDPNPCRLRKMSRRLWKSSEHPRKFLEVVGTFSEIRVIQKREILAGLLSFLLALQVICDRNGTKSKPTLPKTMCNGSAYGDLLSPAACLAFRLSMCLLSWFSVRPITRAPAA